MLDPVTLKQDCTENPEHLYIYYIYYYLYISNIQKWVSVYIIL